MAQKRHFRQTSMHLPLSCGKTQALWELRDPWGGGTVSRAARKLQIQRTRPCTVQAGPWLQNPSLPTLSSSSPCIGIPRVLLGCIRESPQSYSKRDEGFSPYPFHELFLDADSVIVIIRHLSTHFPSSGLQTEPCPCPWPGYHLLGALWDACAAHPSSSTPHAHKGSFPTGRTS